MNLKQTALGILLGFGMTNVIGLANAEESQPIVNEHFKHVLLISIDGLHAIDLEKFIKNPNNSHSALAELAEHGVRYTNASTSKPSDSFPGILSIVTGGSPVSTGVFYDVSWDRTQFAPTDTECKGPIGNQSTYDETIDVIDSQGNDLDKIDETLLPNALKNGKCVRVYPHDFVKVNTIFEVIKKAGGHTAWADKHPAYDLVNGPSGKGVDDLYTPEITNPVGFDNTVSTVCTVDNDSKKVNAILNEIKGLDHSGTKKVGVPTIFGMNFQAVSVGQKLGIDNINLDCKLQDKYNVYGKQGGYLDAAATPSDVLSFGLKQTDQAIDKIVDSLKTHGLYDSTLIVITAKHGQSPIDKSKSNKVGGLQTLVQNLPDSSTAAAQAIINAGENEDDFAMIWLNDQTQTEAAAQYLRNNQDALHIQTVLAGESIKLKFNNPLHDNRTPDIIVLPNPGTIYTKPSKNKTAEHGGFADDDTNVGLLISNPAISRTVIKTPVTTTQVAPTILRALNLDPDDLQAVQIEHTEILPGF